MRQEFINGQRLKEMVLASAQFLDINKQTVDSLNVFPVPDGDTGTNMALTLLAAAKEVQNSPSNTVGQVADALSRGSLKGARGNSGVILSQLFRGFAKALKGEETIDTKKFSNALRNGVDTAYKAVMKPVEGTILTVARVTADEARKTSNTQRDFIPFFEHLITTAKLTLDKTPNLLPVLKQAGVVDSGGMGLVYIIMGASQVLKDDFKPGFAFSSVDISAPKESIAETFTDKDIEFGYCTEFFITNLYPYVQEGDSEKLREKLNRLGDSLVLVEDEDIIKVHIHTNMPGKILQFALRYGELSGIKIDNMREQHRHVHQIESQNQTEEPEAKYGVLAVAMGDGIASIFKDLAVDCVLEGGQTMNPSTEDILKGVEKIHAKEVYILPNNSNIIMSAKQAQQISKKKIHIIPSKTIPQGLSAMVAYNPDADADINIQRMTEALSLVKTGQITYSVRDSNFNGITIKKDNIIGIVDGEIRSVGEDVNDVTKDLVQKLIDEDSEIITFFYGKDVTQETAEEVVKYVTEHHPDLDVELYPGGQPLYYYIISVE